MDIICELDIEKQCEKYPKFDKTDIEKVRIWLEKNPHLPRITNQEIFLFLLATNFSVEASKTKIDGFYTCRTHLKDLFEQRDPKSDDLKFAFDVMCHMILPKRTPEGYDIIFMRLFEPKYFNLKLYMKMSNLSGDIELLSENKEFPKGCVFLIDVTGGSLAHLAQVNLPELKKLLYYLTETYPVHIKGTHFINFPMPLLMEKVLGILKSMVRSELAREIHVHENLESLSKFIPLECLPNDYEGGKQKSTRDLTNDYYDHLLKHRDYFIAEPKERRVNEKLRPEKLKSSTDIFGLDGNFKKLDID